MYHGGTNLAVPAVPLSRLRLPGGWPGRSRRRGGVDRRTSISGRSLSGDQVWPTRRWLPPESVPRPRWRHRHQNWRDPMPRPTRRRSGGRGDFGVLRTDPPPPTEPHRAAGDPVGSAGGTRPLHGQGRRARCRRRGVVEGRHPVLRGHRTVQAERLPACGERRRVHRPAEPVSPARSSTMSGCVEGPGGRRDCVPCGEVSQGQPLSMRSRTSIAAPSRPTPCSGSKALGVSYGGPRSDTDHA